MTQLHELIATRVKGWRDSGYQSEAYPALAEILEYQVDAETGAPRFLRLPQLRALETYWYLRVGLTTPHIFDLYRQLYPRSSELRAALGLTDATIGAYVEDNGPEALWERLRTDDNFVRDFKLEALRESLNLAYPSYILALAMGAGKTILIGAIIATEFAMAQDYPTGPFVQNALVFAPGKTILESLRELAAVPYDRILPPRLHKTFAASVKLTFTRDGEKDVPVIRGSLFNLVVTNTEKIRIQKETVRQSDVGRLFSASQADTARAEVANLRLQAIASLPHLGVFSDEAHHTYGQALDTDLKRVRQTVDYLAANTNLVAVVNTTGTPYYQRQLLRDVVIWYGLSEGIRDNILKDLSDSIQAYDFAGDTASYVAEVVADFFRDYGAVRLPNGAPAKLAIYFPQTDDLRELKPVVDRALVSAGLGPAVSLVNTSDDDLTKAADVEAFNRLNDPASPYRVILLVNKGTEGWNCPSLFACALARRLRTSNNFVLQAATRCLRQVAGNTMKARVYLSNENYGILDRQLQETYGESIQDLNHAGHESLRARIVLRKLDLPPLVIQQVVRRVVRREAAHPALRLEPVRVQAYTATVTVHTLAEQQSTASVLQPVGPARPVSARPNGREAYAGAVELAARYRLDVWAVYDELRRLYGTGDIPPAHLDALAEQIEAQLGAYVVETETVEVALALVRPEGFDQEIGPAGVVIYTAEIVYPKDREALLLSWEQMQRTNRPGFGFHFSPYNFDSNPEKYFFEQLLTQINLHPSDVEDIYFTGALTDANKTDFLVSYKDAHGKPHNYAPDFIIRRKPPAGGLPGTGRAYIVEVKREHDREHPIDGEQGAKAMAVRRWVGLNPDRLRYEMIFTDSDTIPANRLDAVRRFVIEGE